MHSIWSLNGCDKVVVVIPRAAEDVRLVDHAIIEEVLEEWARHGSRHGMER
jgi:hypothetical protein